MLPMRNGWKNVDDETTLELEQQACCLYLTSIYESESESTLDTEENFSCLLDLFSTKKAGDGVWAYEDVYFFYKGRNREGLITQSCE